MPQRRHSYVPLVAWTGNLGAGTSAYSGYSRDHEIRLADKPAIEGSSDPAFRGDASRWNPEELLVASLAQCHMLTFLHLAADSGVCVTDYTDTPIGTMVEAPEGGGHFESVVLRPSVRIGPDSDERPVAELHERAHRLCFLASSVNFPVTHEAVTIRAPERTR